jgi:hypothetical protein
MPGQRAAGSAARPRTTAARTQRGTGSSGGGDASAPSSIAVTSAAIVIGPRTKAGAPYSASYSDAQNEN